MAKPRPSVSRSRRALAALAIAALLSLGLTACGAATNTSTQTSSPRTPTNPSTAATTTTPEQPATQQTPSQPNSPGAAAPAAASPGAAVGGFRAPKGDNSIPDFGHEASVSQRQLAISSLTAFMRARASSDWPAMCEHLARPLHKILEGFARGSKRVLRGCGQQIAATLTGPASERADTLTHGVAALRINGETAFALFYGPSANKYVMPMRNENGSWKMTQLAPLPYPLTPTTPTP